MITNNYKAVMKYCSCGTDMRNVIPFKDPWGADKTIYSACGITLNKVILHEGEYYSSAYSGYTFIRLGTGTNAENATDYTLSGTMTGMTLQSYLGSCALNGNTLTTTFKFILLNNGSSDLTFTEFGIYCDVSSGSSSAGYNKALVYRKLFDEPITFAVGISKELTITFESEVA